VILLDSPAGVQAAAGLFTALCESGQPPPEGMYRALIAAARVSGLLHDPAVLTASKWQDWLHPRGKDGRFIEKLSFVNVFASENALISDRTADRRRAKIVDLRPEGAYVTYQDINGDPLAPDDAAGYPQLIPVDQLSTKVSTAPKAIAHLQPGESAAKEVADVLEPAMSQADYDDRIAKVNAQIREQYPEQIDLVSTGQGKISDADFTGHVAFVAHVDQTYVEGEQLSFGRAFKDSFGLWSEEWQQIFDAVVDEIYDEVTENQTKPRNFRSLILGGLPGAGKSSTLKAMAKQGVYRDNEWITANPDIFKDKMIERGLFPQIEGLTPAETASFIHEASSEMNHMLEQLLTIEGYNVIFDITLGGRRREGDDDWNQMLIDRLESLGYATDGIFVDVPPATSRQRTTERHRAGLDALRTGRSSRADDPEITNGGRIVPEAVIAKNEFKKGEADAEKYNSVNARNFDALKASFVRWAAYDNSGKAPVFVGGTAEDTSDTDNLPGVYPPSAPGAAA
jgi:hypothetical protein